MKRSKTFELNLNTEFEIVVLLTIFTCRKNYGITCAIPCSVNRGRNYPITLKKSTYEGGTKIV